MPLVRRWKRLGFTGQLAVLLSVSLVIIAALVISIVAVSTANDAGRQGKSTAECVNRVLGDRNGPTTRDAAAHIKYALADKRFTDALTDVVTAPQGSQAQRDAYDRFVAAARQKKVADAVYVQALLADQAARNAKPFGKC